MMTFLGSVSGHRPQSQSNPNSPQRDRVDRLSQQSSTVVYGLKPVVTPLKDKNPSREKSAGNVYLHMMKRGMRKDLRDRERAERAQRPHSRSLPVLERGDSPSSNLFATPSYLRGASRMAPVDIQTPDYFPTTPFLAGSADQMHQQMHTQTTEESDMGDSGCDVGGSYSLNLDDSESACSSQTSFKSGGIF